MMKPWLSRAHNNAVNFKTIGDCRLLGPPTCKITVNSIGAIIDLTAIVVAKEFTLPYSYGTLGFQGATLINTMLPMNTRLVGAQRVSTQGPS